MTGCQWDDRAGSVRGGDPDVPPGDIMNRGRRSIGVDLKSPEGVETVLRLVEQADAQVIHKLLG